MDIYGSFQFCSLGVLVIPLIVRISRTYFDTTGRNVIFSWLVLMVAGLLSLAVEFIRVKPHDCAYANSGSPLSHTDQWNYGDTCGLTCSEDVGPSSPMRRGAASNIYVIPAPTIFTLRTAAIVCAACCILPMLSVSMGLSSPRIHRHFTRGASMEELDRPVEGTNNATPPTAKGINARVGQYLAVLEAPIILAVVRLLH